MKIADISAMTFSYLLHMETEGLMRVVITGDEFEVKFTPAGLRDLDKTLQEHEREHHHE